MRDNENAEAGEFLEEQPNKTKYCKSLELPICLFLVLLKEKLSPLTLNGFSLWLFRTMEYISDKLNSYPPHIQLSTFQPPKLFFYMLEHNVPLYLTLKFTNCVLLFYLPLKKHGSFHTVNKK